jgi:hypothetical protein
VFFSYVVIAAVNVAVFGLLMAMAFPDAVNIKVFFMEIFRNSIGIYVFLYEGAAQIVTAFRETA